MTFPTPFFPPPPAEQWPATTGPDCPGCGGYRLVKRISLATGDDGVQRHLWWCAGCQRSWGIPVTVWPVLDGPDCPVCNRPGTRWHSIDPDYEGDRWECPAGHEFVLQPDGTVLVPPVRRGEVA